MESLMRDMFAQMADERWKDQGSDVEICSVRLLYCCKSRAESCNKDTVASIIFSQSQSQPEATPQPGESREIVDCISLFYAIYCNHIKGVGFDVPPFRGCFRTSSDPRNILICAPKVDIYVVPLRRKSPLPSINLNRCQG